MLWLISVTAWIFKQARLQLELEARGLQASGNKPVLANRLHIALTAHQPVQVPVRHGAVAHVQPPGAHAQLTPTNLTADCWCAAPQGVVAQHAAVQERPAEVDAELLHLREMVCITISPVICLTCPPACARPDWVRFVVDTFSHAGSCSPDSANPEGQPLPAGSVPRCAAGRGGICFGRGHRSPPVRAVRPAWQPETLPGCSAAPPAAPDQQGWNRGSASLTAFLNRSGPADQTPNPAGSPRCRRQVDVLREELSELRASWAADQEALQDAVDSARTVQLYPYAPQV